MKKFSLKYKTAVYVLLSLIIIICLSGTVFNVYNILAGVEYAGYKLVSAITISVIALLIAVTAFLVLFNSKYVIKDNSFLAYFGIVKVKRDIFDIVALTEFKISNNLVVYFKDGGYTVAIIKKQDYDRFISALRTVNPEIKYNKNDEEN